MTVSVKAVIFDIGGVVLGSPIVGVQDAERAYGLPSHYLNVAITASGERGAFQRLERGEVGLDDFYRQFGEELSDSMRWNAAYERYCTKTGKPCPQLPTSLRIDGRELWGIMMEPATRPDPFMIEAINALRRSGRFQVAALTNNFAVKPSSASAISTSSPFNALPSGEVSADAVHASLLEAAADKDMQGAASSLLKGMFDEFIESSVENLRKPDPRFYQVALEKLKVKPEEVVFLDDIGINLVAARKLGIRTIRVAPGRSQEAIAELERIVGLPLRAATHAKL